MNILIVQKSFLNLVKQRNLGTDRKYLLELLAIAKMSHI